MSLSFGTRLGAYEIVSALGAGGMGEVYRARDTKLNRDVAIKVLPELFAGNPERLARFTREAQTLAALNHPNVAHIHGLEESSGVRALVMELVEGDDLAQRITRGPVPVDEALTIAKQIADALEAAHEQGIVHRDLKPANIKVRDDGTVKVLDFGLAKLVAAPGAGSSAAGLSMSPTITTPAMMTGVGMILGTAAYMSPEQARGKAVDKRADIWAFGCVLIEMLTGKRAFEAEDVSLTLAEVMKSEPDWASLPALPPAVRMVLRQCLKKDPRQRLRDIGEARLALEGALDLGVVADASGASAHTPAASSKAGRALGPVAAAALLLLAAASGYGWWRATRPVARPLTRLSVDLGPEAVRGSRITAVLSPDGTRIVFTGRGAVNGTLRLFTRRLDQQEATPLSGTESSTLNNPFFSPDGEWVGFGANGKVMKVATQGGSAIIIGESATVAAGASWGDDGNIILGNIGGLMRLPAAGGVAERLKQNRDTKIFPQVLPGSRAVLVNTTVNVPSTNIESLDIGVLVLDSGETKTLIHGGYWPRYLATSGETGHLVYMHEGTLFGVAFDPRRLELRGTPAPLLEDVAASASVTAGGGQYAFSETGTFVYLSGRGRTESDWYPMMWMDAAGKTTPLVAQPAIYNAPRVSPDGTKLAYKVPAGKGGDVWVYDLQRETPTQLTFTGPGLLELAWAPDSKHIVFSDGAALWWIRADGSGQAQRILDNASNPRPFSFAPDGRLAFSQAGHGLPDVWTLPLDLQDPERPKPGKAEPFLADPQFTEVDPAFSPDGKFLAYASNESGIEETFVRSFPGPGGKWRISIGGGKFPAFARATHELFFLGGDDRIMVVNYTIQGDSFSAGTPRVWSSTPVRRTGTRQNIDVTPDGKRVVMFPRPAVEQSVGSLHATFLLNFFDEVRRKIP
jgi:serine/threonine-protein kinase